MFKRGFDNSLGHKEPIGKNIQFNQSDMEINSIENLLVNLIIMVRRFKLWNDLCQLISLQKQNLNALLMVLGIVWLQFYQSDKNNNFWIFLPKGWIECINLGKINYRLEINCISLNQCQFTSFDWLIWI